jgi:hypothetical protein
MKGPASASVAADPDADSPAHGERRWQQCSGALVRACPEAACGRWICLEETRVGKSTAMATATAYCSDELGARHVCFLDADSYCLDEGWIEASVSAVAAADGALGYVYSPLIYDELERTPVFAGANRACEAVLHRVIRTAFSFAPACAATYPADLLLRFLLEAQSATEQGLRLPPSTWRFGRAVFHVCNPGVVVTSGRRLVLNGRDLRRWCFYDREFYARRTSTARPSSTSVAHRGAGSRLSEGGAVLRAPGAQRSQRETWHARLSSIRPAPSPSASSPFSPSISDL